MMIYLLHLTAIMAGNLVLVSSTETHGKSAFGKVRHYSEFRGIGRGSSDWVNLLPFNHTFNCNNKVRNLEFCSCFIFHIVSLFFEAK